MNGFLPVALIAALLLLLPPFKCYASLSDETKESVDFARDIRPLLSKHCLSCHGRDPASRKAGLRLDIADQVFKKRGRHSIVIPYRSTDSELFRRVSSNDSEYRMPPPSTGDPLTEHEIAQIRHWIDQGAKWKQHWSFETPEPQTIPPVQHLDWARNEIDFFILSRLEEQQLQPSFEADKRTLIRRLSLDLTGLPPKSSEVNQFLHDTSPDAYEKLVERLLASSHYGERMATAWLDTARYSDTYGYHEDYPRTMWPWRDWVIGAFNSGMRFDQFTIEQLAGDLLTSPTNNQLVATGFNRLHGVTSSGIPSEYRAEYVIDRATTTATTWLGLTMGCARCHDHKYDPITQEDFYRFFAFFNHLPDKAIMGANEGNLDPLIPTPGQNDQFKLQQNQIQLMELKSKLKNRRITADEIFASWKQTLLTNALPTDLIPDGLRLHFPLVHFKETSLVNLGTNAVQATVHGSLSNALDSPCPTLNFDETTFVSIPDTVHVDRQNSFSYGAWVYPEGNGAILAKMGPQPTYRGFDLYLTDGKPEIHLIHHWPDNALHVRATTSLPSNFWTHLFVTYDGSSLVEGITLYVNGTIQEVQPTRRSLTKTIHSKHALHVGRRMQTGFFKGSIADVRMYDRVLLADEIGKLALHDPLDQYHYLASPESEKHDSWLFDHFLDQHDPTWIQLQKQIVLAKNEQQQLLKQVPTSMVMQDMEKPRETYVLTRGQYEQRGKRVTAETPVSLMAMPVDQPRNRLGLARWLVDPKHPLTSRVAVNRFWQILFGKGLVVTSEDFGTQGSLPTHPRLLDWLANRFVASGWDIKGLIRLIVTSSTYRQNSASTGTLNQIDPDNALLARGPRYRMSAEMIRDSALSISGLLVGKIGGPSVKPYQPAGLWKEMVNASYEQDHGDNLYRRTLYTFWKRSVPPPNLLIIDAPTREVCTVRRQRTNTPLAALVLMNDPTFLEAARHFAEKILSQGSTDVTDQIAFAFDRALARPPSTQELQILQNLFQRRKTFYLANPEQAISLVRVGESERNDNLSAPLHAAWTTVASVILNLDESLSRE